jgi:predicted Zn-dependent protease
MADTHTRCSGAAGGDSLYLARWSRTAAVVVLLLLTGAIVHGQTLTFRNPRDLLVGEPAAFVELLQAARPAPVSTEDMVTALKALPPQGEVTKLGAAAQQKVDAVHQLLTATQRDWYEIKVIDLPQAAVALYARTVVLISEPALALVNAAELQALTAHEIGHEYLWTEWVGAHQRADQERLKTLELVCDAIAAVTLRQLGMDASTLIDGVEKIDRFNRQRFGPARNDKNYPTLAERRAFAREIAQWLSTRQAKVALRFTDVPGRR